jgi:2-iminobutanoate/2-iminopropanoate deaminase
MAHDIIHTDKAPAAIGPYSQATRGVANLFTSGQLGIDPVSGELPEDFTAQARQAFENLKAIIEAAGGSMSNVMKITIFLTDMANFPAVNAVMQEYCQAPYPARSCFAVAALPKGGAVEIEAIAHI